MEKEGAKTELFEEVDFSDFTNIFSDLAVKPEESGGNDNPPNDLPSGDNDNDNNDNDLDPNKDPNKDPDKDTDPEGDQQDVGDEPAGDTSPEGDGDGGEPSDPDDNSSPLTPYAKLLVDEGILPNLNMEEFDGTGEGLVKAMGDQISTGIDDYKSSLPIEVKTILENYEEGIPLSTLLEIDSRRAEYKAIPADKVETDKELQKSLVHEFYKQTTRFSEEKINKLIQQADDLDELKIDAKSAHEGLIGLQDEIEQTERVKAKEQQELQKKVIDDRLKEFKQTLEKTIEIIPGVKVNPNSKKRIESILTTSVAQDERGNPLTEIGKYKVEHPYEFDIMLAHLFDSTKGFKDWSMLESNGKKSAISDLEKAAQRLDKNNNNKVKVIKKETKNSKDIINTLSKFSQF